MATGDKIQFADYNLIRSKVAKVLGPEPIDNFGVNPFTGLAPDPTYGYGQTLNATETMNASKIITLEQWQNLRKDLVACRRRQAGPDVAPSVDYGLPALTDNTGAPVKVSESIRAAFLVMANTIDTERLNTLPGTEATRELVAGATQPPNWNTTKTHTVYVTWPSADAARYYFNAGGEIWFYQNLDGGTSPVAGTKDYDWAQLLITEEQPVRFGIATTRCDSNNSNQTVSNIGVYEIPTAAVNGNSVGVEIYRKVSTPGAAYANDGVYITARWANTQKRQIEFVIQFRDGAALNPTGPGTGGWVSNEFGVDELVTGTLRSYVGAYRPSSLEGVNLPAPTAPPNYIV